MQSGADEGDNLPTVGPIECSLVIPLYNEADNLAILMEEIDRALEPGREVYEVLFVDDGSTDDSLGVLRRLAIDRSYVRIFSRRDNAGQSAALIAGFRAARGAVIVTLDADLQNDPADIPMLLAALKDHDVVSGIRAVRHDSRVRRWSSRIANGVRRWVIGDRITDVGCSLKAYRSLWLQQLPAFNGIHRFLPGLLQVRGARVVEVVVKHRPRARGLSKYGVSNRLWRGLADLAGVRWLQKRWVDGQGVTEVYPESSSRSSEPPPR